jgi:hypothetical protein
MGDNHPVQLLHHGLVPYLQVRIGNDAQLLHEFHPVLERGKDGSQPGAPGAERLPCQHASPGAQLVEEKAVKADEIQPALAVVVCSPGCAMSEGPFPCRYQTNK